jgi:hypothetical protein
MQGTPRARLAVETGAAQRSSRVTLEADRRLAFHSIGGDWARSDGEWRLTPIDERARHACRIRTGRVDCQAFQHRAGVAAVLVSAYAGDACSALRREAEADGAQD